MHGEEYQEYLRKEKAAQTDREIELRFGVNSYDSDYWDRYCRVLKRSLVRGYAIINEYISGSDALTIEYSFN